MEITHKKLLAYLVAVAILVTVIVSVVVVATATPSSHLEPKKPECGLTKEWHHLKTYKVTTRDGKTQVSFGGQFMFYGGDSSQEGYLYPILMRAEWKSITNRFKHLMLTFDCVAMDVFLLEWNNKAQITVNLSQPLIEGKSSCWTRDIPLSSRGDSFEGLVVELCEPAFESTVQCQLSFNNFTFTSL